MRKYARDVALKDVLVLSIDTYIMGFVWHHGQQGLSSYTLGLDVTEFVKNMLNIEGKTSFTDSLPRLARKWYASVAAIGVARSVLWSTLVVGACSAPGIR